MRKMKSLEKTQAKLNARLDAPRRKRRGLGIVELGLYLIIVALLIAAVIVAFYQLQTNSQQTQTTNLVNETYSGIQDLHRSATSYGADGTDLLPILEGAEMIPPIGRRDPDGVPDTGDEQLFTPFGEEVTVVAGGATGVPGQSFTIALTNYTRANCIDFMSSYVDRTLEQSGLLGARSNGTPFAIPATVASINGTCAAGDLELEFR
jgi:type II secretory pathway pseudopilin PulG